MNPHTKHVDLYLYRLAQELQSPKPHPHNLKLWATKLQISRQLQKHHTSQEEE